MSDFNRYQQGKIYRLIDLTSGMYYIGSTCLARLDQRYHTHKFAPYTNKKKNYKVYKYFTPDKFNDGNIRIELIEEAKVMNKKELFKIENEHIFKHIDNPLCVNTF